MNTQDRENEWKQTLPKKRMAAGALFLNSAGKILVVEPKYGSTWEIPGGVVENNESPRQACVREIKEELGLTIPVTSLLCVDYRASTPNHPDESLQFIFFGGLLSDQQIHSIKLEEKELQGFHWLHVSEISEKVSNSALSSRILIAYKARVNNTCVYRES